MKMRKLIAAVALCATAGAASAADPLDDRMAALEGQIRTLRTELDACKDEARQAGKTRPAIDQVLADAKARSEPFGGAVGYKDGLNIVASPEFKLKLNALFIPRYVYNHNRTTTDDRDETGFTVRRAELYLTGTAFSPDLFYQFSGGFDRADGDFSLITAYAGYKLSDQWQIRGGTFKAPFMVEELTAAGRQQAAERSLVNGMFSVGHTEGVQVEYAKGDIRAAAMFHDGTNGLNTDFPADNTDWAFAARAEVKLAGDWAQFADFEGWSDAKPAVRLGAAIDYESGERGTVADVPDVLKYTADVTVKGAGWNVFAAAAGRHADTAAANVDQYGFLAQGGVFLIPNRLELFARYEHIRLDGVFSAAAPAIDDQLNIVTVGYNWFFFAHNAKLTLDVAYVADAVPAAVTSVGLLPSQDGAQTVIRAQFSLFF